MDYRITEQGKECRMAVIGLWIVDYRITVNGLSVNG